jgi:beta-alanine degradation protein BauB
MTKDSEPGELTLGPIGNEIIFENEIVRVWTVDLAPGAQQAMHQHLLPYLVIPLTEGKNRMRFLSGRVVETDERPGTALWREPGEPHELLNTSTWRYRNILVELKRPAAPVNAQV